MSLSRRQRRQMAKQLGYIKKNESPEERIERIRRSQQMGKQIHLQHLEQVKNNQISAAKDKEIENEKSLINELEPDDSVDVTETIGLSTGSFDFLDEVKSPQASNENQPDENE